MTADSRIPFNDLTEVHVVVTINDEGLAVLHVNGRVFSSESQTLKMPFKSILNLLGVDICFNNGLVGSINEFRVWSGAMNFCLLFCFCVYFLSFINFYIL